VGGWVCYNLVSEQGLNIEKGISWLRSNSDREVEKLRRNEVAKSMQELECQRSFVRVRRIMTIPFKFGSDHHCGIERDPRSLDQRRGEQGSFDESKEKVKSQPSDLIGERSTSRRHCGDPSCTRVNSPRWSCNPNYGFIEGLRVSVKRIMGRKVGYSKPSMRTLAN
jgi:hypothetical protein